MGKSSIRKPRHLTALAAAALAFGVLAGTGTSAQAATAQGYVNGWDWEDDDWADEGLVSTTQHSNSGAAGLWQFVLWADGYLTEADVDCKFGPKTEAATKKWQARFLGASQADGVVGNKTFGAASQRLGRTAWSGNATMTYGSKTLGRSLTDGSYFFQTNYTNGFVVANYNSAANCR
ncbi:peptidoglycan-binding protein [Streptomyces sp. NPDC047718]|uniref:peptidoglycan-binding domain-containing protein n=1 Tax=Streptomyces sp. NPDC047718 TaxID=3155479 RepID=UPI00340792CC